MEIQSTRQFRISVQCGVLRAATLPAESLECLSAGMIDEIDSYLISCMRDAMIAEAIYIASPELHERLSHWKDGAVRFKHSRTALAKYLRRMAFRSVPFGLFAAAGPIQLGTQFDQTELSDAPPARRHIRPFPIRDEALSSVDSLRSGVYVLNSTIHFKDGNLRWIGFETNGKMTREYRLYEVESSEELHAVLDRAKEGVTGADLLSFLNLNFGEKHQTEDLSSYLVGLIESRILLRRANSVFTEGDVFSSVAHKFLSNELNTQSDLAEKLRVAHSIFLESEQQPSGMAVETYTRLNNALQVIGSRLQKKENAVQVDFYLKETNSIALSTKTLRQIEKGISAISALTDEPRWSLSAFHAKFEALYGDGEVPLLEMLSGPLTEFSDNEGPPSLITSIFGFQGQSEPSPDLRSYIVGEIGRIEMGGKDHYISVFPRPSDLNASVPKRKAGPQALVGCRLWEVPNQSRLVPEITGLTFQDPTRVLGRFSCGSKRIAGLVKDLRAEAAQMCPDLLLAEIVHLPDESFVGLVTRDLQSPYEIPICASASSSAEVIPLSDILVSVSSGIVRLRSKSRSKFIDARMANAHAFNSQKNIAVYRFLNAVSTQYSFPARVTLRNYYPNNTFVPGLMVDGVIITRPTWTFRNICITDEWKKGSEQSKRDLLRSAASQSNLPRWFSLMDGEHHMPFDLESDWMMDELVKELTKSPAFLFSDLCPNNMRPAIRGPSGHHHHEIFIPLCNQNFSAKEAFNPTSVSPTSRISIGEEWLYFNIYCSEKAQNGLIIRASKTCLKLTISDDIEGWFFVRYFDSSGPHLRLRVKGDPKKLLVTALPELSAMLRAEELAGMVSDISINSYVRETSRYGGERGLSICEKIFFRDSQMITELLSHSEQSWESSLMLMESMLEALGVSDLSEKHVFASRAARDFFKEQRVGSAERKAIGLAYKKWTALNNRTTTASLIRECDIKITQLWLDFCREVNISEEEQLYFIRWSLIHMRINRYFNIDQRKHETVAWDLLRRSLEARVFKSKMP